MDEFIKVVTKAMNKKHETQCECPKCGDVVNVRYNNFTENVQAMCEGCGGREQLKQSYKKL